MACRGSVENRPGPRSTLRFGFVTRKSTGVTPMPRPRKIDPRQHQVNVRFSAPEYVKLNRHAALTGKSVADFARDVLLRRPRRRKTAELRVLVLSDEMLARWAALGGKLNDIAHLINGQETPPPAELERLLTDLMRLFRACFGANAATSEPTMIAPIVRHHVRRIGVNLVQIRDRLGLLGFEFPKQLLPAISQLRELINRVHPPHGP